MCGAVIALVPFRECCERFTRKITRWPRPRPADTPSDDQANRVTPLCGTQLYAAMRGGVPEASEPFRSAARASLTVEQAASGLRPPVAAFVAPPQPAVSNDVVEKVIRMYRLPESD